MLESPQRPKREHPRVAVNLLVKLDNGVKQFFAHARDLSMTGLFLDGPVSALPKEIGVRIPLPGQDREVVTTCRVERYSPEGVALSFAHIDWSDLILVARHLAPRL
jgi:hypothetical protein